MSCSPLPPSVGHPRFDPAWLSETVLLLARGIAADVALDRLPVLADALEEAGCDNFGLLNHLRTPDPHHVGCWALRRVLRTTLLLPGGVPLEFAYCPAGSFLMGSTDADRDDDEIPVRRVTISHPLQVGVFQITQQQWRAVTGENPSEFRGDRRPVEMVSWADAVEFCRRAAEFTGTAVRLPTEAEWEHFGRAGTATAFWYGDEPQADQMNCNEGPNHQQTTDAGSYPPNPWGLFDTHGNVMEWCEDWYTPGFYEVGGAVDPVCRATGDGERPSEASRCVRGGSWRYNAAGCRSALRNYRAPAEAENCVGFRVVFAAG